MGIRPLWPYLPSGLKSWSPTILIATLVPCRCYLVLFQRGPLTPMQHMFPQASNFCLGSGLLALALFLALAHCPEPWLLDPVPVFALTHMLPHSPEVPDPSKASLSPTQPLEVPDLSKAAFSELLQGSLTLIQLFSGSPLGTSEAPYPSLSATNSSPMFLNMT